MKLADALVAALRDWGVEYVFGVSGANIEHVHDAVFRLAEAPPGEGNGQTQTPRLQSILAKSETGAAFMADARARIHRTLGVCCATSGGGMMNLAVGIAESYAESVPVLALVGQVAVAVEGRGGFQDSSGVGRGVDALALFRAISKFVARIDRPTTFWRALFDAAKSALSGRPGPSVLLFPRDIYDVEVGPRPPWFPRSLAELRGPPRQVDVDALFALIASAKRPVLVIGSGVGRSSDPEQVRAFAREARVPVVTTMADPGAFPNDDALYLGAVGASGHPSAHAYINEHVDLIVAVGTGLNIMTRQALGRALERAKVAVVNVDGGDVARAISPELIVEGDAGGAFSALRAKWRDAPFEHATAAGYTFTRYSPQRAPGAANDGAGEREPALLQSEAIDALNAHLTGFGHVVFDAGNCAAAALHDLCIPRGVSSTIALGMGGMGYSIPAAIGAQLGDTSSRRTLVLCGDGAFLMLGLEVHTAVDLKLPILFVIFNNAQHGMCTTRQRLYFGGRVECATYAPFDAAAVCRGLGPPDALWVGRARTRRELRTCLEEFRALDDVRPGVLELVLTREQIPPFFPFVGPTAPTFAGRRGGRTPI